MPINIYVSPDVFKRLTEGPNISNVNERKPHLLTLGGAEQ